MVKLIFILVFVGIGLFGLIWAYKFYKGKTMLIDSFSSDNVIVYGLKGHGKDLIFNKVINARNVNCYANIPYNKNLCVVRSLNDFSVEPNTSIDILNDDIKIIKKTNKEETDLYISDGGIYLPSHLSNTLVKKYPSLPIYYALNRHLTKSNIHINTQYLGRVWDKLREHAGYYIKACKTYKLFCFTFTSKKTQKQYHFGWLITKFNIYDKYDSAMSQLEPYEATGLITRSESRANKEDFKAKHGTIQRGWIIQPCKHIYYDSRYFHKKLYGYNSPDTI